MADRCDDCGNRVGDGVTSHTDDCPQRAPELRDELSSICRELEDECEHLTDNDVPIGNTGTWIGDVRAGIDALIAQRDAFAKTAQELRTKRETEWAALREFAQELLTSYQKFASDADGVAGLANGDLETRARKLGLDPDAWLGQ